MSNSEVTSTGESQANAAGEREHRLMRLCARTSTNPEIDSRVASLINDGINWAAFVDLVQEHRVLPLVYTTLSRREGAVPDAILAALRAHYIVNMKSCLQLTRELALLAQTLASESIDILPFKGPALAQEIYPDIALRQSGDLDILIRKRDLKKAFKTLLKAGYEFPIFPDNRIGKREHVGHAVESRRTGHFELFSKSSAPIEMHISLGMSYLPFCIDPERVWRIAEPIDLFDQKMYALPEIEELLYLVYHGSKHGWYCLSWVCDIAEFIRTHADINWGDVIYEAICCRTLLGLLVALKLAKTLLDAPLNSLIEEQINQHTKVKSIEKTAIQAQSVRMSHNEYERYQHRFRCLVIENSAQKVRYIGMRIITPTLADWKALPLPRYVAPLYYIYRPFRLASIVLKRRK